MWVRFLGGEDPLEEGMGTHSSILAWRIPWAEEPGGLSPQCCRESDMTEATEHAHTHEMMVFTKLTVMIISWSQKSDQSTAPPKPDHAVNLALVCLENLLSPSGMSTHHPKISRPKHPHDRIILHATGSSTHTVRAGRSPFCS